VKEAASAACKNSTLVVCEPVMGSVGASVMLMTGLVGEMAHAIRAKGRAEGEMGEMGIRRTRRRREGEEVGLPWEEAVRSAPEEEEMGESWG